MNLDTNRIKTDMSKLYPVEVYNFYEVVKEVYKTAGTDLSISDFSHLSYVLVGDMVAESMEYGYGVIGDWVFEERLSNPIYDWDYKTYKNTVRDMNLDELRVLFAWMIWLNTNCVDDNGNIELAISLD